MPIARVKPRLHLPALNRQDQRARGLASYWPFWEGAGDTVRDIAGLNDGTINGVTWETSERGIVTAYDGSSSIDLPATASWPTAQITVAGWIYRDPVLGDKWTLFCSDVTSYNNGAWLGGQDGYWYFYLDSVENRTITGNEPGRGKWLHVAGTWDGALFRMYLDGDMVLENPETGTITNHGTGAIGFGSSAYGLTGMIGTCGVWSRGLLSSEIQDLYEDPYFPITPRKMFPVAVAAGGHPTMRRWGGVPYMTPGYQTLGRSW